MSGGPGFEPDKQKEGGLDDVLQQLQGTLETWKERILSMIRGQPFGKQAEKLKPQPLPQPEEETPAPDESVAASDERANALLSIMARLKEVVSSSRGGQRYPGHVTFIHGVLPEAALLQALTGIPMSVPLSQTCLETGYGKSYAGPNAYFGVKGKGTAGTSSANTTEYVNGQYINTTDNFRQYNNTWESFEDYGNLISKTDRYKPAMDHTNDPDQMIGDIHAAGYATDPNYVRTATGIMDLFAFRSLDPIGAELAPLDPTPDDLATMKGEAPTPETTPSETPTTDKPAETTTPATAPSIGIRRTTTQLNLRAAPGLSADILTTMPAGGVVEAFEERVYLDGYQWVRVTYEGQAGYCASAYLATLEITSNTTPVAPKPEEETPTEPTPEQPTPSGPTTVDGDITRDANGFRVVAPLTDTSEAGLVQYIKTNFANGIPIALYNNKPDPADGAEFERQAKQFASREHTLATGSGPGGLATNAAIPMDTLTASSLAGQINGVGTALANLMTAHGEASPKIGTVAIFTHGWSYNGENSSGIRVGQGNSWSGMSVSEDNTASTEALVNAAKGSLSNGVKVLLFACSTAYGKDDDNAGLGERNTTRSDGGEQGFADALRDALANAGLDDAEVWGHTAPGHTTRSPALRVFRASTPDAAGEDYFSTVFDDAYIQLWADNKGWTFNYTRDRMQDFYVYASNPAKSGYFPDKNPGAPDDFTELAPMDPTGIQSLLRTQWETFANSL